MVLVFRPGVPVSKLPASRVQVTSITGTDAILDEKSNNVTNTTEHVYLILNCNIESLLSLPEDL